MVRFADGSAWMTGGPRRLVREALTAEAGAWEPAFRVDRTGEPASPGGPSNRAVSLESGSLGTPDPFSDLDSLLELEDEIRSLSVQIHKATHRLLVVLAEFDRRRGWEVGGHRCCADWLAFTTGIDRGAARERVRAARALAGLPAINEAMGEGRLTFSQVRALTRVATPDNEDELLPLALENSSARLERILRGWRRGSRQDEALREEELHRSRALSVFPGEEGMYVVKGILPAELGLLLMRALDAASDALFREEGRTPPAVDPEESRAAAARRRADALGLLAERAMAAGFGAGDGASVSGTRPERYQVVLHVDEEALREGALREGEAVKEKAVSDEEAGPSATTPPRKQGGAEAGGGDGTRSSRDDDPTRATCPSHIPRSHFDDGTRVSSETSRRLCCDAAVVRVRESPEGEPLSVGRRSRTIPPALRRALELRDRGCRFPGCGCRFTDAHHVVHWADGGETSLSNCLLLCRHHHRLVHEGGWQVRWWGKGRPVFVDPRGGERFDGGWHEPGPEARGEDAPPRVRARR